MEIIYTIVSVIIVSLVSVIFALPFFLHQKIDRRILVFLLSISVGVLLSTVFVDLLPEAYEMSLEHEHLQELEIPQDETVDEDHETHFSFLPFYILAGFLLMFILEKLVHFHHDHMKVKGDPGHGHAYSIAPMNLIGDGVHNFLDGLVIAGAYMVDISVGIAATISVIFHEIPQELADFGVLLYSGMNKIKALLFNLLSSLTAIAGAIVGIVLSNNMEGFSMFIIPFAAGNFLYIAAANLIPQLHRHENIKDSLLHVVAIIIGIGIIVLVHTISGHTHA
ncbi:ZIP family metal transporter [Candidatus Woesearchaeota archaeon]|nr:ZIP family metal transporter [Candidatus Woesearchaeota archaeon]